MPSENFYDLIFQKPSILYFAVLFLLQNVLEEKSTIIGTVLAVVIFVSSSGSAHASVGGAPVTGGGDFGVTKVYLTKEG
jgi:hypothetical protein